VVKKHRIVQLPWSKVAALETGFPLNVLYRRNLFRSMQELVPTNTAIETLVKSVGRRSPIRDSTPSTNRDFGGNNFRELMSYTRYLPLTTQLEEGWGP
jgi:hypothetical protein